jgi:LEA14-like dessication related protein
VNKFLPGDKLVSSSLLVAGMCFAACATVPTGIESPKISITNIEPKDFTLWEQRFNVQLRIQNQNEKDLTISGVRFEIDLNEREFANGMSGERVVVSRFGSQIIRAEMITGFGSFLRQFQELNKTGGRGKLRYRIRGTTFVDSPGIFRLPFDEKGGLDLGFVQQTEQQQRWGDTDQDTQTRYGVCREARSMII